MDNLSEQFSRIYDEYIEKIYRFVYLKVNSQEIAEDLTSKVFLKGWEAFKKQGSGIKNYKAFLYQIARNAVIDHYRERGRTKTVPMPQLADLSNNLEDRAILRADLEVVKTAILKLKKDYQDILILHYINDMPIADISKVLDKPAGTIRVMLHRGIKELKGFVTNHTS